MAAGSASPCSSRSRATAWRPRRALSGRDGARAAFFARRVRRIYPPYLAALAFTAAISLAGHALSASGVANGLWDRTDIGRHWITNATLLEESVRLFGASPEHANAPAWSLCYEAQFYVLVGLLLVAASARRIAWALASMSAVSVAMAAHYGPERAGLLTDLWPHFAFGIWAHERERGSAPRGKLLWDLWAGATAAGMLLAYGLARGRLGQEAKQVVICAAFALALVALRPRDLRLAANPAVAALAWVGRRSYSIYLLHFPVVMSIGDGLYLLGWARGWRLYPTALFSSTVAVALALAFYRFVERPFLGPRAAPPPRP